MACGDAATAPFDANGGGPPDSGDRTKDASIGCVGQTPTACNGACINEQTDNSNCGGCGAAYACAVGKRCNRGACAAQLAATALPFAATQNVAFSGNVATVADLLTTDTAGALSAVIDWGDGHTSAGTVTGASGSLTVSGTHTYLAPGTVQVKVTVTDSSTGATADTNASVSVAPQLVVTCDRVTATAGLAVTGSFARITDAIATESFTVLTGSIDWGDGTTSFGTVSARSGKWIVSGAHTYASTGINMAKVTVSDTMTTALASASFPVDVRAAPQLTAQPTMFVDPKFTNMVVGPDGELWVGDNSNEQILRISTADNIDEYAAPGAVGTSIAVGPDGKIWYASLGNLVSTVPTSVVTFVQFAMPAGSDARSIATGPDGNLWVGDRANKSLDRVTIGGVVTPFALGVWPSKIVAGADGKVWWIGDSKIGHIDVSGLNFTMYTLPTPNAFPVALSSGLGGNIWFTEQTSIGEITPNGDITEFVIPAKGVATMGTMAPNQIAIGPDGNMWFTGGSGGNGDAGMLGRISPGGAMTLFSLTLPSRPDLVVYGTDGIVAGPDGNVWLTINAAATTGFSTYNFVGYITP